VDVETNKLIEALKYWTADRFKSLQRKLTTASNIIRKEALSPSFRPFLSEDEKETLEKAAIILSNVKRKVEHAKEIKARKEREWTLQVEHCRAQRKGLFEEFIPNSGRDLLLLRFAIGLHHSTYSSGFFPENSYIATTLNRVVDINHHFNMQALYSDCRRDLEKWLVEDSVLWDYDKIPTAEEIEALVMKFNEEWRESILSIYKDDIEKYDNFYAVNSSDNVVRLKIKK